MADNLENAKAQGQAQYNSIREMVAALTTARKADDDKAAEAAEQTIHEDALSVEVCSGWHTPGSEDGGATHYRILLCTGGPACQITGELSDFNEPSTATIQIQDWFTPWTDFAPVDDEGDVEETLLAYARAFYFGEG